MAKTEKKLIANNKKAYHDYFILEKYEAGLVLHGTEVKSLRMGKCSIKEAFIRVEDGEMYIYGMHIWHPPAWKYIWTSVEIWRHPVLYAPDLCRWNSMCALYDHRNSSPC